MARVLPVLRRCRHQTLAEKVFGSLAAKLEGCLHRSSASHQPNRGHASIISRLEGRVRVTLGLVDRGLRCARSVWGSSKAP